MSDSTWNRIRDITNRPGQAENRHDQMEKYNESRGGGDNNNERGKERDREGESEREGGGRRREKGR